MHFSWTKSNKTQVYISPKHSQDVPTSTRKHYLAAHTSLNSILKAYKPPESRPQYSLSTQYTIPTATSPNLIPHPKQPPPHLLPLPQPPHLKPFAQPPCCDRNPRARSRPTAHRRSTTSSAARAAIRDRIRRSGCTGRENASATAATTVVGRSDGDGDLGCLRDGHGARARASCTVAGATRAASDDGGGRGAAAVVARVSTNCACGVGEAGPGTGTVREGGVAERVEGAACCGGEGRAGNGAGGCEDCGGEGEEGEEGE